MAHDLPPLSESRLSPSCDALGANGSWIRSSLSGPFSRGGICPPPWCLEGPETPEPGCISITRLPGSSCHPPEARGQGEVGVGPAPSGHSASHLPRPQQPGHPSAWKARVLRSSFLPCLEKGHSRPPRLQQVPCHFPRVAPDVHPYPLTSLSLNTSPLQPVGNPHPRPPQLPRPCALAPGPPGDPLAGCWSTHPDSPVPAGIPDTPPARTRASRVRVL